MAFQQKLREFENERGRQQQQQQQQEQRGKQHCRFYKPPSTASSFSSLVSAASSTNTVVPSGDQKMRMRSMGITVGGGQEGERDVREEPEDEDSMCSSTYYTARSSFSHDRSPGV